MSQFWSSCCCSFFFLLEISRNIPERLVSFSSSCNNTSLTTFHSNSEGFSPQQTRSWNIWTRLIKKTKERGNKESRLMCIKITNDFGLSVVVCLLYQQDINHLQEINICSHQRLPNCSFPSVVPHFRAQHGSFCNEINWFKLYNKHKQQKQSLSNRRSRL